MLTTLLRLVVVVVLTSSVASADELIFAKKTLQILKEDGKKYKFTVEIADTYKKREQGLMFRKTMPENYGMLFLFDKEFMVNMWMKDTYIPLDIVFIKSDWSISNIVMDATPLSLESITSAEEIIAVLELNAGICKKLGINKNNQIVF